MESPGSKRAREEGDILDQSSRQPSHSSPKRLKSEDDLSSNVTQNIESTCSTDPKNSAERLQTIAEESTSHIPPPPAPEVNVDINDVKRFEALWHDDGDMILWVENYPNKTEALLFRIHRQVLAESKLEPFRTAIEFDIPPAGTTGELFLDGVWVNKYEQQSPAELAIVLIWVYTKPMIKKQAPITMDMIKILLKRSKIHDNVTMRRCALEYLWNMFPTSLNYHHRIPCFVSDCYSDDPSLLYDPYLLYTVIQMADEHRLLFVLPLLYYYIAQWPLDWISEGLPGWEMPDILPGTRDRRFKLPQEHAIRILKGRSLLIEARREIVFNYVSEFSSGVKLEHPTPGCPQTVLDSGETCFNWLVRVHTYLRKEKYIDKPNALEIMNTAQWKAFRKHLCDACAKRVMRHMLKGRDEVWESLPKWFGCKSWEEALGDQHENEAQLSAAIS